MVFLIRSVTNNEWHRIDPVTYVWTAWQPTRDTAISAPLNQQHPRYTKTITEYLETKFSHNQTVYLETDTDYIHLPSMEYVQQHYPELLV